MSDFSLAIPTVLRREGGYVLNSSDPGGATNFGISLRWLKGQGLLEELELEEHIAQAEPVEAIRQMTVDEATAFYKKYWWDAFAYGSIIVQALATKVFDTSVNVGPVRAHKFLQTVVGLPQDGILGPKTIAEANSLPSLKTILAYQEAQAQFYRNLVIAKPAMAQFLNGWLARAYDRV